MRSSLVLKTVLSVICVWTTAIAQEPASSQSLVVPGKRVANAKVDSGVSMKSRANVARQPSVVDCQLQRDALVGRMRLVNGQAAVNARLQLLNKRGKVLGTNTDARGNFVFESLPPGLYALHAEGVQSQFVRVWSADVAPPASKKQLLVVRDDRVVRGQYCSDGNCTSPGECADCVDDGCGGLGLSPRGGIGSMLQVALDNPWFVAAGTAAAIAIPLATTDDDERPGDATDAVANGEDAS